MRWFSLLLLCAVVLSFAGSASAHGKSASYSRWELSPNGARVRLRLSKLDASALGLDAHGDEELARHVSQRLTLWSADSLCRAGEVQPLVVSDPGWLAFEWRVRCPPERLRIDDQLLFDVRPAHLHFAVVVDHGREHEWVLSGRERSATLTPEDAAAVPSRFGELALRFVPLGARHVGGGLDHLVFLLVLALGARSWRRLAWLVSGFTLGHAVSSSLAVLGCVATSTPAVEALIAASIAVVAVENVWLRGELADPKPPAAVVCGLGALALVSLALGKASGLALLGLVLLSGCYFVFLRRGGAADRVRVALTAGFGLVHGLGFASGMRELGLGEGRVFEALVGFNVGIELAQLGLLGLAGAALWVARRAHRRVDDVALTWGSALALACACFWLVPRALG